MNAGARRPQRSRRGRTLSRLAACGLAGALGLLAGAALLGAFAGPLWAAPAATRTYPGDAPCNTTLQACIDGSVPGDTIVIQPNTYAASLTLNKAVSLTGVSSATTILQALPGQRVLTVTGAAVNSGVSIAGLTFTGGDIDDGIMCPQNCGGGVLITGTAQPLLRDVTIRDNAAFFGGGVFANTGSPVHLAGSQLIGNSGVFVGGGLYAFEGAALTGTQFLSNTTNGLGGGASAGGAVTLNGGLFRNNRCTGTGCLGGGLSTNSMLTLSGTQFISNSSVAQGGGVFAAEAATLQGGRFEGNTCSAYECDGGGAYFAGGLAMTGTQWVSNTAGFSGGGAFVGGAATLHGGLFQGNIGKERYGGGLHVTATLALSGTQFIGNDAKFRGGGANVEGAATLHGGLFQDNHVNWKGAAGGGLYTGGALALTGTQFMRNQAIDTGGGAYAGGTATLHGGLFQGNRCTNYDCRGGGLWTSGSGLALTGTQFIGNQAVRGGGLVHTSGTGRIVNALFAGNGAEGGQGEALFLQSAGVTLLHTTIASPSVGAGAAIYVTTGTVGITNSIIASHSVGINRIAGSVWENYNLFFGNGTNSVGADSGGSHPAGDPAFRDPAAGDYHLLPGSPALDVGFNAGVTTDFENQSRPLGTGIDLGYDELLQADVAVSKSDGRSRVQPGDLITYTILVENDGAAAVTVVVNDSLPAALTGAAWTCVASAGSSCPASGSGSLNASVTLGAGSFVEFRLQATVAGSAGGSLTNTATAILPASVVDTNLANNSATDVNAVDGRLYLPVVKR